MSVDLADAAAPAAAPPPGRLRGWIDGVTTPDRLRRVGVVLVVGCVLTAVVSLVGAISRTDAVRDGGDRLASLTSDAAELYRALADADAMATSGYVSGGIEPAAIRARYDTDIGSAAQRIVHAAGLLAADDPAAEPVATISAQLPIYSGLIETARTYNRQGLPLGQSYLNSGSTLMRTTILPAVERLRTLETAASDVAYGNGGAIPFAVLLLGIATLAGVIDAAVRERRRTHRVLNLGLVGAGVAVVAVLLWWLLALVVEVSRFDDARGHSTAATTLDDARAAVLQARSNESLVLVARGGGSADQGFTDQLDRVVGPDGNGGLLAQVQASGTRVDDIRSAAQAWRTAHRHVRELDDSGRYADAVAAATGADPAGSGATFERLDKALGDAIATERAAFERDADAAAGALSGLAVGPAVLALLAAAGVVVGIGTRVGEYR
ncbi:hypothetical protein [Pseudonocardia sp. GCM10023141]|uniref:hypothetical protein n=1 Tax=Pseudonocardia sp. GCM10023141 TaxID=3252653 RepID=UPI003615652B